jgi:hypothetical protein
MATRPISNKVWMQLDQTKIAMRLVEKVLHRAQTPRRDLSPFQIGLMNRDSLEIAEELLAVLIYSDVLLEIDESESSPNYPMNDFAQGILGQICLLKYGSLNTADDATEICAHLQVLIDDLTNHYPIAA